MSIPLTPNSLKLLNTFHFSITSFTLHALKTCIPTLLYEPNGQEEIIIYVLFKSVDLNLTRFIKEGLEYKVSGQLDTKPLPPLLY